MRYALPKIRLKEVSLRGECLIVWVPMIKIWYKTGKKKKEMCFDGYTPVKLDNVEAFLWFMRNPKHFKVREGKIDIGVVLPSLTNGRHILEKIKELRHRALEFIVEAGDSLTKIPRRYMLQLLIPAQAPESKKLKISERYFPIFALIDAIKITEVTEYLSEKVIYWPLVIDMRNGVVFEPALKKDISYSYTEVHKRFNILKLIEEYIE